jgi:hypothetical protein
MSTQIKNGMPSLTINQRNLYTYYLAHKKRHGNNPCFVPRVGTQTSRLPDYLKALAKLEEYNLISVDRTNKYYTAWIIKDPIVT